MRIWRAARDELKNAWRSVQYDLARRSQHTPKTGAVGRGEAALGAHHGSVGPHHRAVGRGEAALGTHHRGTGRSGAVPGTHHKGAAGQHHDPFEGGPRRVIVSAGVAALVVGGAVGSYFGVVNGLGPLLERPPVPGALPSAADPNDLTSPDSPLASGRPAGPDRQGMRVRPEATPGAAAPTEAGRAGRAGNRASAAPPARPAAPSPHVPVPTPAPNGPGEEPPAPTPTQEESPVSPAATTTGTAVPSGSDLSFVPFTPLDGITSGTPAGPLLGMPGGPEMAGGPAEWAPIAPAIASEFWRSRLAESARAEDCLPGFHPASSKARPRYSAHRHWGQRESGRRESGDWYSAHREWGER